MSVESDIDTRFVHESGIAGNIAALAEPVLEDMGYRLVRVVHSGRDGGTVQIMADKKLNSDGDNRPACINIDDCTKISRALSPVLEVSDPIDGHYRLEISTPGIDRPLVRPRDFIDWQGYEARLKLKQSVEDRRRFQGTIEGFEEGEVRLTVDLPELDGKNTLGFQVSMIEEAKLVMNDNLLRASLSKK